MADSQKDYSKILLLGAGLVAEPAVDYLLRDPLISLTVASAVQDEVNNLCKRHPSCNQLIFDVTKNIDVLDKAIQNADLVISLLPSSLQLHILKHCIRNKTHLVTSSYMTPEMVELNDKAMEAGITVLNEVGLDPGIDHLLALNCIREVEQGGGEIESFISYCGGLSAPDCSNNPLYYTFTWCPRNALSHLTHGAKFYLDGEIIDIAPGGALLETASPFSSIPGIKLEGLPNGDSTIYKNLYGIPHAKTILRGTLRYKGFSNAARSLVLLGLIDETPRPILKESHPDITWRQLICSLFNENQNLSNDDLREMILEKVGSISRFEVLEGLGLLSDTIVEKRENLLDTLADYLTKTISLGEGENDLVVLLINIEIMWSDGSREYREVQLILDGETDGYTAMAKTVGSTVAIAAKMVLSEEIKGKGMVLPFSKEIVLPMLERLAEEGIEAAVRSRII